MFMASTIGYNSLIVMCSLAQESGKGPASHLWPNTMANPFDPAESENNLMVSEASQVLLWNMVVPL